MKKYKKVIAFAAAILIACALGVGVFFYSSTDYKLSENNISVLDQRKCIVSRSDRELFKLDWKGFEDKESLTKELTKRNIFSVYNLGKKTFIDSFLSSGERVILCADTDTHITKYTLTKTKDGENVVVINSNNNGYRVIKSYSEADITESDIETLRTKYLDPFKNGRVDIIKTSNKQVGPSGGAQDISIHEEISMIRETKGEFVPMKLGSDIVALSMFFGLKLDLVLEMLEDESLKVDGANQIPEEFYLCVSKTITFDYEKRVETRAGATHDGTVFSMPEKGEVKYELVSPSPVVGENQIYKETFIQKPKGMSLDESFYIEKAKEVLE